MTPFQPLRRTAGFTLVELLIGMVILSVVISGVIGLFRTQLAASVSNDAETALQANVQAAMNIMQRDIIMAGFGKMSNNPIVHADAATATASDSLTITSAAAGGNFIHSFVAMVAPIYSGNEVQVRCWGPEGRGGKPDPLRDVAYDANRPLRIFFVSPMTGEPLNVGGTTFNVTGNGGTLNGTLCEDGPDLDLDGNPDPILVAQVSPSVNSLPRGTIVYGARVTDPVSYTVSGGTLFMSGVPLLRGVEDMQFEFQLTNKTSYVSRTESDLSTLTANEYISQVNIGLVVRALRTNTTGGLDPRTEITTFGHTIPLSTAQREFPRKQYFFSVRPRNYAF